MSGDPQTKIVVTVDDSKVAGQLARMQSMFKTSFVEISSAIAIAQRAYAAMEGAIRATIKAAMEVEAIEAKASASMRRYGVDVTSTIEALKTYNAAMQAKLGVDGDALLAMQSMLASVGVAPDKLRSATQAAIGLSRSLGTDLEAAATVVAKTLNGSAAAATRLGLVSTSASDAFAKMLEMYKDTLGTSESVETKQRSLAAAIGDVAESIGKVLIKSSLYVQTVEALSSAARSLASTIDQGGPLVTPSSERHPGAPRESLRDLVAPGSGLISTGAERRPGAPRESARGTNIEQIEAVPNIIDKDAIAAAAKNEQEAYAQRSREYRSILEQHQADVVSAQAAFEEAERMHSRQLEEIAIARNENAFDLAVEEFDAREKQNEGRAKQNEDALMEEDRFRSKMIEWAAMSANALFDQLAEGAARGESAAKIVGKFLFGLMKQAGSMLISLGVATVSAATASVPAPWTWGITGGPAGIGAGVAMIAAGTLLSAGGSFGSAILGGSSTAKSTPSSAPTGTRGTGSNYDRYSNDLRSSDTAKTTVINIAFNKPVGNPRRTARELQDALAGAL